MKPTAHPLLLVFATALLALGSTSAQSAETNLAEIASFFATAQIVEGPDLVDCTLSGGTETTCFSITVRPGPRDYTPGPWCPSNISDGAEAGGIWFFDGATVDVDGAFIANLAKM